MPIPRGGFNSLPLMGEGWGGGALLSQARFYGHRTACGLCVLFSQTRLIKARSIKTRGESLCTP